MTTEQYSIGYDEGYQAGWNDAQDAKREWVGLTDEEIEDCYREGGIGRACRLLKEKNHG